MVIENAGGESGWWSACRADDALGRFIRSFTASGCLATESIAQRG
jgi:hypothetical protein